MRNCTQSSPAISAIIIFYNAERFVREAIESVLSQTEQNWELLLCDDGSTDGSTDIARDYVSRLPAKLRYLEHGGHQNRGMSATRNLGIQCSRGRWIAFLDADDFWHPCKLAEQMRLLKANASAGLLYGSPLYWFSWSPELARFSDVQPGIGVASDGLIQPPELLLRNYPLGTRPAPCPSDLIVSRQVIERVGGFEESFNGIYQMYEDQPFLTKVYRTTPVFVSRQCWTRYRQHPAAWSTSIRDAGRYREVRGYFLDYLRNYLIEQGETNPDIWKAVQRSTWPYRHSLLAAIRGFGPRIVRRLRRELTRS